MITSIIIVLKVIGMIVIVFITISIVLVSLFLDVTPLRFPLRFTKFSRSLVLSFADWRNKILVAHDSAENKSNGQSLVDLTTDFRINASGECDKVVTNANEE